MIAERAKADGVKVLLGGEGADEIFGGYGSRHVAERARFGDAYGPRCLRRKSTVGRFLQQAPSTRSSPF
jgi:asparagine synthetase B (glutamine-hydrolysing)